MGVLLAAVADCRRIRVRPVGAVDGLDNGPQQVEFFAEQEEDQGPILVSRQDTYGRATGQSRVQPKLKPEAARTPPVQTIRNYNKLNDDGSFTFGYEAADGSFKEETRGTDCVVRGKYGYIDPDGNKSVNHEEDEVQEPDSGEENIPRGPIRPLRPLPKPQPPQPRPTTTVFQQDYNRAEEEEEQQVTTIRPRPQIQTRFPVHSFAQLEEELRPHVLGGVTARPSTKAVLLPSRARPAAVPITPRPATTVQLPATTYRPQLLSVTPTAKLRPATTLTTTVSPLDFEQELKNFQLENNVVSTPRPQIPSKAAPQAANQPVYTSELVFDPSTGQYNTVVYQQLPQTTGDISLRQRLQPFVAPQTYFQPARQPFIQPTRAPAAFQSQEQLFRQQQAALFQQSQQLFEAQQQKKLQHQQKPLQQSLLQQQPQRFAPTAKPFAQPIYYVAATGDRGGFASGQIDAFLRGHSIAI
ncbi:hypothetical protein AAG570_006087 [Ranatra chinensis]|uniref:Uncharacterized protein n=1 Tax=Ranatra chinensis TaxID=642074 RepID=A0ABD0XY25_9HEMI